MNHRRCMTCGLLLSFVAVLLFQAAERAPRALLAADKPAMRSAGAKPTKTELPTFESSAAVEKQPPTGATSATAKSSTSNHDDDDEEEIVPLRLTDTQWRARLTRKQFAVTRLKETEDAYTGKFWNNKRHGTYRCVCCELELFNSDLKFESNTGWPSFFDATHRKHLAYALDDSEIPLRTEVLCARCDAHLGHIFNDGPPPTGHRYCINSAALEFVPDAETKQTRPAPATRRATRPAARP